MELKYKRYDFTPILGWSISRYEVFDKCKRQYYYHYYSRFVEGVPHYKLKQLKGLTSFALEVGNVVHDIIEAFLRRLQKSASDIDENKFFEFARTKTTDYFCSKTFLEVYYNQTDRLDTVKAQERVATCLHNFVSSPVYSWIFMKGITNRDNWMIEPEGYGETRLKDLKAYCKMDFLFPVDNEVVILDWKTGRKDAHKHSHQIIGYAAAASSNFGISWQKFFPKVVYLYPQFDEFELTLREEDFGNLFEQVRKQTHEMYSYCADVDTNTPKPMDSFPMSPSENVCRFCSYQELCFPDIHKKNKDTKSESWE